MKLALFDLDHTLIPFDSGMAWTRFLVARGVLPADAETVYLGYRQQYVDGTLDIRELHRVSVAPLGSFGMATLRQWAAEFEAEVTPRVPDQMRALVKKHQDAATPDHRDRHHPLHRRALRPRVRHGRRAGDALASD